MASVTSLGLHKPSAIPFMVTEGILPPDPSEDHYTWQVLPDEASTEERRDGEAEEEILFTDHCVVWSRGAVIQRVFRYEVEGESVCQALITKFDDTVTNSTIRRANTYRKVPPYCPDLPSEGQPQQENSASIVLGHPGFVTDKIRGDGTQYYPGGHNPIGGTHSSYLQGRALVVIFTTQAHVHYLSGASHIVHLPFEVQVAFPCPQGILLQRKVHADNSSLETSKLAFVPPNSFASTNSGLLSPIQSLKMQSSLTDTPKLTGSKGNSMYSTNNLRQLTNGGVEMRLPRLFTMRDPLAELGVVVEDAASPSTNSTRPKNKVSQASAFLDLKEDLLYISPDDELQHNPLGLSHPAPCILAVTHNIETSLVTAWAVKHISSRPGLGSQVRQSLQSGVKCSRRRSSYGQGLGTGATTPVFRGHSGGKELSVVPRLPGQASIDDIFSESFPKAADELTLKLEPGKSSRRIGSLLARADLSTSHDISTFTELASGHAGPNGSWRVPSADMHGSRPKLGLEGRVSDILSERPLNDTTSTADPSKSLQPSPEDDMQRWDAVDEIMDKVQPNEAVHGLHKEMILTKLQSIPISHPWGPSKTRLSESSKRHKVFTLKKQGNSLISDSEAVIFLCIVDRVMCQTSVIEIKVRLPLSENRTKSNKVRKDRHTQSTDKHSVAVSNIQTYTKVIDACRIRDGSYCQLLMIRESDDGMPVLSLQPPCGVSFKIEIPRTLIAHQPYQLGIHSSRREQSDGGLGRTIVMEARDVAAFDHEGNNGRVDLLDKEGSRHRIQIQLIPCRPLIQKMIRVVDSVLTQLQTDGEWILRSWWNLASWLRTLPEEINDIEWTAMIVVLFCLAAGFHGDQCLKSTESKLRQKRRKDGLLRSSSGANTDLENWETMLDDEIASSTIFPGIQDTAWGWTVDQNNAAWKSQVCSSKRSNSSNVRISSVVTAVPTKTKSSCLIHCLSLARRFLHSPGSMTGERNDFPLSKLAKSSASQKTALATALLALHLLREEYKLNLLAAYEIEKLAPVLAQIGGWQGWNSWGFGDKSFYFLESACVQTCIFDESIQFWVTGSSQPFLPPSILRHVEITHLEGNAQPFITLADVGHPSFLSSLGKCMSPTLTAGLLDLTPRTLSITNFLAAYTQTPPPAQVEYAAALGINISILETLPESIAVLFRASMSSCQLRPLHSWNRGILKVIGRDDIGQLESGKHITPPFTIPNAVCAIGAVRDVRSICNSTFETDLVEVFDGSTEADRQAITRMIFKDDQRFAEATRLVHPLHTPVARCAPEPHWSDTELLEAQQELVKVVAARTLSVSLGRSLIFYSSRVPLLTEKLPIHGFTLSCVMKPTNTTVTADRNAYSEEKVSWAFFHAGVEAGLRISKNATGVDTSWILFNKPQEFKNRHAGFLLALGLNGHLKSIAKWVSFKYLTPKHTMTSIGLLLGLSASYLGTMDTLITRLLSVHVTRMLPSGAAELNISPLTQTSGLMGIGILYCNSQHRRMSEIMLSEMENIETGDISSPLDSLRDEGYRLAAGFALGYINLGRGQDLKGLHDMRIVERLLALAVGTRKVNLVHVLDKATAAAVVAIALIFMKTQDPVLAHKIDIPNTTHQFDYVRPDIFLLRTVARHLIMWDDIQPTSAWLKDQLPSLYQPKSNLTGVRFLSSADMPFLNIIAGLCLSIGLRFAGSGGLGVRNLLCHYLDQFMRIYKFPTLNYDGKLARITVRCCLDTVALATSCVMAGTGDLVVFRRLRSLHGRTDVDTPYGSHLAAHLAIGVLFLGGGTHTFGTSNVAIASLLCAFYPLFPNTVLDNKSHLQAFRHFWVLATEPRCLIARDADTHRPIPLGVRLVLRTGAESLMTAPCLLPELEAIAAVHTNDSEYWPVTLDLINKSNHREAFARHQSIYVRRRSALDAHISVFSSTMRALNDSQASVQFDRQTFCWIFSLPVFARFDQAERALVLPSSTPVTLDKAARVTVVDDRLALETTCMKRGSSERLWNLRALFAWAEGLSHRGEHLAWVGKEVVGGLRTILELKIHSAGANKSIR